MTITQEDIQWTVEFWADIWREQGKQFVSGRILDPKTNTSVSIHQFIDGFLMLGGDWKEEMERFRDAFLEKKENQIKGKAIREFIGNLDKINWEEAKLVDSQENVHRYVMMSEHQVVTESVGSFFVWDKSSGGCLIQGCESLEMLVK